MLPGIVIGKFQNYNFVKSLPGIFTNFVAYAYGHLLYIEIRNSVFYFNTPPRQMHSLHPSVGC